jgi:hypothetical protein
MVRQRGNKVRLMGLPLIPAKRESGVNNTQEQRTRP